MTSKDDISVDRLARIGGALYVAIIALGFTEAAPIRERIVVSGDVAATAQNLTAMEGLWRIGIASDFVVLICSIALAMILYRLLRPVSSLFAGIAIFFNLVSLTVEAVADLFMIAALLPLGHAKYLTAFPDEQRFAFSSLAMRMYDYGFGVALIFFGVECVILGYLIYRSIYLPKAVGVLMAAAGASYLINSFSLVAAPTLASALFPLILLPSLVGESSLALWLLIKGVDKNRFPAAVA